VNRRILLVEDNAGDAQLMRIALAEAMPAARLSVATDGEQALAALEGGPPPDLVLLDLNLPRLSGHELLAALRASEDAALRRLPVVILTTSDAAADVERSYELGAFSHITKPADIDRLFEVVGTLARYWFETVTLPS
jgi:two-component system, chemotaxis family, response regulator Rcp1